MDYANAETDAERLVALTQNGPTRTAVKAAAEATSGTPIPELADKAGFGTVEDLIDAAIRWERRADGRSLRSMEEIIGEEDASRLLPPTQAGVFIARVAEHLSQSDPEDHEHLYD